LESTQQQTMKIIFLDIDGVLNHELWYRRRHEELYSESILMQHPYDNFDPLCIEQLNRIVDQTGAKAVVSSTWRHGKTVQELHALLTFVGFKGEVISKTPDFHARGNTIDGDPIAYDVPRGCEIDWWLDNEGKFQRINWSPEIQEEYIEKALVKNYIILDDDSDMLYCQREHFVRTNSYSGLTEELADKSIEILNKKLSQLYY
jgi:hypothetical protein